eukprot:4578223-Alexandrium_andersonii.AAC.1
MTPSLPGTPRIGPSVCRCTAPGVVASERRDRRKDPKHADYNPFPARTPQIGPSVCRCTAPGAAASE